MSTSGASVNLAVVEITNEDVRLIDVNAAAPNESRVSTLVGGAGRKLNGAVDGVGTNALFSFDSLVAGGVVGDVLHSNTWFVADTQNCRVRRVFVGSNGSAVTEVFSGGGFNGTMPGNADGSGTSALWRFPMGVSMSPAGDLLVVSDTGNKRMRLISLSTTVSSALAGGSTFQDANDGVGSNAHFSSPVGVVWAPSGVIYVADMGGSSIRAVALDGTVSTLPTKINAFDAPQGLSLGDSSGSYLIVADTLHHQILLVRLYDAVVLVLAGSGQSGYSNGFGNQARFNRPQGVVVSGCLLVGVPHPFSTRTG